MEAHRHRFWLFVGIGIFVFGFLWLCLVALGASEIRKIFLIPKRNRTIPFNRGQGRNRFHTH